MAKYGYLQQDLASKLTGRGIGILSRDPEAKVFRSPYHSEYFVQYAKHELIRRYGEAGVFGGGYRVTTSLDPDLQQAAWQAVRDHLPNPHDPEGALVAIDPQTGDIRAMIGGRSFRRSQVNLATSGMKGFAGSGRQAGSAFKAFTLVAAMREHYDLNSWWNGPASITIPDRRCYSNGKPWAPVNASDSEAGTFTLERATWFSVNTVFAQLAVQVGPDKVREAAWDLGIRSKLGAPGPAPCSITLGVEPVAPLEMTNAYATLAANGVRHFATPIEKVSDRRGAPIADLTGSTRARSRAMTVLDENDAALVTKALTGVVKYGTGTAAQIPGHDVAGKTGTAQNYVDAWFCGYTPQLVTCVWVGYPKNDRTPLVDVEGVPEVYGGTIPAAIWHDFMSVALENVRNIPFPAPTSTNGYTVGPSTAAPAPSSPSPSASESASPSPSPSPRRSPSASPSTSPSATASPTTSPAVRVRSHVR
jgi:penicillin-binding protein 1A